jgi:hypothetical protein
MMQVIMFSIEYSTSNTQMSRLESDVWKRSLVAEGRLEIKCFHMRPKYRQRIDGSNVSRQSIPFGGCENTETMAGNR